MITINRPLFAFQDSKTMDFLAIAIMLLFTALLFATFGFPALKDSLGMSQSILNTPSSIVSQ